MRDSISRCDGYNPYDMRPPSSSSGSPSSRAASPPRSRDIMETSRERLREEEADTIRRLASQIPKGSLLLVARAGKYLFIAILLPPYFLLYRVPRWIVHRGIPPLLLWLRKGARFPVSLLSRMRTRQQQRVQSLKKMIRSFLQWPRQRAERLRAMIKEGIQRLLRPWVRGTQRLGGFFRKSKEGVQQKRQQMSDFFQAQVERMQAWLKNAVEWIQHPFARLSQAGKKGGIYLEKLTERTQELWRRARTALHRIAQAARKGPEWVRQRAQQAKEAVREWAKGWGAMLVYPFQKAKQGIVHGAKVVAERVENAKEKIGSVVQHIIQPLVDTAPKVLLWFQSPLIQMGKGYQEGKKQLRRRWQAMKRGWKEAVERWRERARKAVGWGRSLWQRFLAFCQRVLRQCLLFLRRLVPAFGKGLLSLLRKAVRWGFTAFRYIRYSFHLAGNLVALSWHMAKQFLLS